MSFVRLDGSRYLLTTFASFGFAVICATRVIQWSFAPDGRVICAMRVILREGIYFIITLYFAIRGVFTNRVNNNTNRRQLSRKEYWVEITITEMNSNRYGIYHKNISCLKRFKPLIKV